MLTSSLIVQVKDFADEAAVRAEEYSGVVDQGKDFITDTFGQNGLYAAYVAAAVILIFVLSRVAKLTFSTLKFLVIPSVALAFLATLFLPYSFVVTFPVSVTVCSLFLLFKG